ncbi:phosphonate ABC transporter ATP-binding protein [Paenibacillus sp. Marseille-Q4541]|uniref:phosphonate ABC transporter ATP-binding protein n=1 Tax=Paenibacillus sp. Marseille-Q4541 TaxID=2831522 RepID=UPI001BA6E617|nr:phosphonate ABC transporter ATP-binding protein [Paenibacillus sp. Marseille-Q4541]
MIEFINVQKTYHNGTTALKKINLKIEQGEFVAVIGLSGAGKSTLIRCINRMHDITDGQLLVDQVDVSKLHGKQIRSFRRRIGMIFQSFNLVNRISVMKNVLVSFVPDLPMWRKLAGIFTSEQKLLALEALDKVGILDKAYIRVDQLSGGQQQRVALARTLAQNPDIILADEPIASLDPVTSKIVMEDFKKINQTMNISVIMNIHHVEIALEYASRIIGVREGEIVFDGAPSEVTQHMLDMIYGNVTEEDNEDEETASPLKVVSGHV